MLNIIAATQSLINLIWKQPQNERAENKISEYVREIRIGADRSDPVLAPDPIAFTSVLAEALHCLVPKTVVIEHKDDIDMVMNELAEIITETNGSSWPKSRKDCLEGICIDLHDMNLVDSHIMPKLMALAESWNHHGYMFGAIFRRNCLAPAAETNSGS